MPWIFLIVAGLLEAGWAIGLKYTQGFTKLVPSVLTFAGIMVSMYLLESSSHAATSRDHLLVVGGSR